MCAVSRIVCAVDTNDDARTSFEQALALARARDAALLLVCAVPPARPFSDDTVDRLAYLRRIRNEAERAGLAVHVDVQHGETAEVVVRHASARAADLIVVALEHGRAAGERWGAVAEAVVRSAPCPTLVVCAGAANQATFRNVLCALDIAGGQALPIADALMLSGRSREKLTALHVAKSADGRTLKALQELVPQHTRPVALASVATGSVVREVMKMIDATGADLLVIGARPRSWVGRRFLGVTRQLLNASPRPVLAVPVARELPARRAA